MLSSFLEYILGMAPLNRDHLDNYIFTEGNPATETFMEITGIASWDGGHRTQGIWEKPSPKLTA